jgi:hypothetical protein
MIGRTDVLRSLSAVIVRDRSNLSVALDTTCSRIANPAKLAARRSPLVALLAECRLAWQVRCH